MLQLTKPPGVRVLELGGGNNPHELSDVRVDIRQGPHTHFTADFEAPLPIADADFEVVYCAYCLEHVTWRKVPAFLAEVYRVLKSPGKAVFLVPNTEAQLKWIQSHPEGWDGKDFFESASGVLFGDCDYPENTHKVFLSPDVVHQLFTQAGFSAVQTRPHGERNTDLLVEALKGPRIDSAPPVAQSANPPTPEAVVSVPGAVNPIEDVPPEELYDKDYWNGGAKYGGYAREGYWDYPCLPPNELIIAEDGLRNIETLREGEKVMTHEGRFRPIVEVMSKPYTGRLLTIQPRYSPPVRLTPEHPVLVVQTKRKNYGFDKPYPVGEPFWVPAGEVDIEKHWLVIPRPAVEKTVEFDSELMRLTGYYLSEGHVANTHRGGGTVSFAFHREEQEYIDDVRNLMPKVFGCTAGSVWTKKNCSSVNFYSPKGKEYFSRHGTTSHTKNIPTGMLEASESSLGELLVGMFRGDGYIKQQKELRYDTVSRSLAIMVRLALLRLGVASSLKWVPPPKKKSVIGGREINSKGIWTIGITGRSYAKLARILRLGDDQEGRTWKLTGKNYDFCEMDDKNLYIPIRSVKEEHYEGMVYNFEVEDDHSYMHPGASLHNCHRVTANHILSRKPQSVLEIGAARGYVLKRIHDSGISGVGLEASQHCVMTAVCRDVVQWDLTKTPWPKVTSQNWHGHEQFDLCYSVAVLEHIPRKHIPHVIAEMARTCKRGLHGIDFGGHDDGFDKTHVALLPKSTWQELFALHAPGWPVEILDKEELERGEIPPHVYTGDGRVKVNVGCSTVMYHDGWINLDINDQSAWAQQHRYNFLRHDLNNGLPFDTGSVHLIHLSHVLEHFDYGKGLKLLKECRRVLRPDDGILRVAVPDAQRLMQEYVEDDLSQYDHINYGCAAAPSQAMKFWELLHSGHSACYDETTLVAALRSAGFVVPRLGFRNTVGQMAKETLDMFHCLSLYADAEPAHE